MTMNMMATFKAALWRRHPVLHGLLGLTPLLAVSMRVVEALVFGLVLITVVVLGSLVAVPVLELAGGPLPLLAESVGALLLLGCLFAAYTLIATDRQEGTGS